jgi:hypothetical protein
MSETIEQVLSAEANVAKYIRLQNINMADMPEELQETVEDFTTQCASYDWDEEAEESEEIKTLKIELKKRGKTIIGLVKEWQKDQEERIEDSLAEKQTKFLKSTFENGKKNDKGGVSVSPAALLKAGIIHSEGRTGTIIFGDFTMSRGVIENSFTLFSK